jgi:hypothetical protein
MLPTKFWINKQSGFRGEDFLETALANEPKHGRKHLWKVLYGNCSFRFDLFTNMAVIDNSCFYGSGQNEQSL